MTMTPADPLSPLTKARRTVDAESKRSTRALWEERLVLALWPAWTVAAGFAGLALIGAFEWMPAWAHWALLALFALGFVAAAVWGLRGFVKPAPAEGRARLDETSEERPIAALDDALLVGGGDLASRAVWAAHQRRMADRAAALKARAADLRMSGRDRLGLRLSAMILLSAGLFVAGSGGGDRLQAALDPGAGAAGTVIGPSLEAWATPPAYTGEQMIYLTERIGTEVGVPEGSRLSIRVYNSVGGDGAFAPFGEATWDLQMAALRSGPLEVTVGGDTLGEWSFAVNEDAPPTIRFDGAPGQEIGEAENGIGALRVDFSAEDDFGVARAWAVIDVDYAALGADEDRLPPPPGLEAMEIELPLPFTGSATEVTDTLIADLTEHPWSGLPVTITLMAEDSQGQRGQAGPVSGVLPGRYFYEPMARALLEERRTLAWSLSNAPDMVLRLKAVTAFPDEYFGERTQPYLIIRSAIRRLDYALDGGRVAEDAGSAMELLWRAALLLEDGDLSSAAERLRRAQERLSEALERGASEEEIARLMDEMRQAMNEYLQEMARQAQQNPQNPQQQSPDQSQQLQAQDLEQMLEEIERMAQEDPEAAQRMLEQLAQMLENLRMQAERKPPILSQARRRAGGLTLAEVLLASVVLAFIVAGLTQTIVSGQSHTYNALHEERALSLAEALMDEVLAMSYADLGGDTTPGPDDGETSRDLI